MAQHGPEGPREAKRGRERPREALKPKENQGSPEMPADAKRSAERPGWAHMNIGFGAKLSRRGGCNREEAGFPRPLNSGRGK